MLRIVHVIGRMPGDGTQRQLAGMLRCAHRRHWNATLAVLRAGDPLTREVADEGIPVVEFRGRDADPRRMAGLRALLRSADVVHSSLWGANVYTRMATLTLRPRPAVVASERSVEDFRTFPRRCVDRVLRTWTDEYIANSDAVAGFVARAHHVPPDRITVIRNGIDRDTFHPDAARPAEERPARLGTVGRLIPDKGVDVLLEALPAIVAKRPAMLTVVGDGPQRKALERRARDLPVEFAGHLASPIDVAEFLRSIDVFVMPSRLEGFPNALIEALACGASVVATDVPGIAEAAAGRAVLVPPDQPAVLAEAVCRSLDSSVRPCVEFDSFEDVAARHLAVFERAQRRRGGKTL
jgi:glycosyltransferase involved in cell wall biosynthesis